MRAVDVFPLLMVLSANVLYSSGCAAHLNLIRDNARLYTRTKMPSTNGPAVSLAAYINDVQAKLTETLLSKYVAAATYETKTDATSSSDEIANNTDAIAQQDHTSYGIQFRLNDKLANGAFLCLFTAFAKSRQYGADFDLNSFDAPLK